MLSEIVARAKANVYSQPTIDAEVCPDWAHDGQRAVWASDAKTIVVCAGNQGGKTALNAHWLLRQIHRRSKLIRQIGFGNFIYAGPTMTLLEAQAMPQLERLFTHEYGLGNLVRSGKPKFKFSPEGAKKLIGVSLPITIHFAYANDPNNLESLTALDAVWDEMGQSDNKELSYEALIRRLGVARSQGAGSLLTTTTPYDWGWYKRRVVDLAMRGDEGYQYVNWPTWMNPMQSEDECRRVLHNGMEPWRWEMMYLGKWIRPAGAVWPNFGIDNYCEPFDPGDNTIHVGLDFGSQNTAAAFVVEFPNGELKVWKSYHAAGDASIHAERFKTLLEGRKVGVVVGGSNSEGQWRKDFAMAGFPVGRPAAKGGELGVVGAMIDRMSRVINTRELKVSKTLTHLLDEMEGYSYDKDGDGRILQTIKDKQHYHRLDALRYVIATIRQGDGEVRRQKLDAPITYTDTLDPKTFEGVG